MPDIHLFPISKIPFFSHSFLIVSYCKNKNKKPRCGFVVHISRSVQKNAQRFYIPFTVTAQRTKSRKKNLKYETCSEISLWRTTSEFSLINYLIMTN